MSRSTREELPAELVWERDGHLGEVALSALADGEAAIVPHAAGAHLEACERCAKRLGRAALLSRRVGLALAAHEARATESRARAADGKTASEKARAARPPLPIRAVCAALAMAALGMVPSLIDAPDRLADFGAVLPHALPLLVRSGATAVRGAGARLADGALVVSWIAAGMLLAAGFVVARAMSRRESLEGGIR